MRKKIIFLTLGCLLVFLTGCSGHGKPSTSMSTPEAPQSRQSTSTLTTAHPAPQNLSPALAPTATNIQSNNSNQTETASNENRWRSFGVSDFPFSPYPTEKQLFARPDGKIRIAGIQADSYGQGMEITWEDNNWEYFAVGHAPSDGERVAKDMLSVLPETKTLVPGAVKGKLRVAQLGNPIYYTASWTYDGQKWYTLDDRGTPEDAVKMLQAIASPPDLDISWTDITHSGGFDRPDGIAVDLAGVNVYVADSYHNRIKELRSGGGAWTDITYDGGFSYPNGVAVDCNFNVYVTDTMHDRIKELPRGSTTWKDITYNGDFSRPRGIAADSSGNVYVADLLHSQIKELESGSSAWKDITHNTPQGVFGLPAGIAVDLNGNVYVTDIERNRIKELPKGSAAWKDITDDGGFRYPNAIAVDPSGNLYVADAENNRIEELPGGGSAWKDITHDGGFNRPNGVAVDNSGNVYVTDTYNNKIKELVTMAPAGSQSGL